MSGSTQTGTLTLEPDPSEVPVKGVVATLGATGIITVAGVGTGILAARILGPEGRGELAALMLWATTLVYSTSFGIADATGYCAAKAPPSRRPMVLATSQALSLLYGVLASVCAWVAGLLLVDRRPDFVAMLVPYVGLYAIPCLASLSVVSFLQGTGRLRWFNISRTSVHVANMAAMLGCVGLGFTTVWAFAVATLLPVWSLFRRLPTRGPLASSVSIRATLIRGTRTVRRVATARHALGTS